MRDLGYIGNAPYNYIYFNCDDLDNQTSETCEVWRIIGVFDVDDGTGNYQRRMKLVRGSALAETMIWDDRNSEQSSSGNSGKNDWNGSYVNTYLNGTYYNSLISTAQSQIADADYYLGGSASSYPIQPYYGSTEDIYDWERGATVYNNTRLISWHGKIALMYPSDIYMIYGKGVDNTCYNDPYECYSTINSSKGWIFNSNTLGNQINSSYIWLLSTNLKKSFYIFYVSNVGNLNDDGYGINSFGVRPVLYLSSNVKIIDGTGEQNNPYKLGI